MTLVPRREQQVVVGLRMAHMGGDGEQHRLLVERLRGGGAADAAAVLQTRMARDRELGTRRASRKELTHALREAIDVFVVNLGATRRFAFASSCARIGIAQAFGLRAREGVLLDQQALTLVT